jgi:hypothetical protein
MHKVHQRRSRVPMYTNYKRGVVELGGEDDGDGNVAEDGDEDTTPTHAKGELLAITVSISPRRWPHSSMICTLEEEDFCICSYLKEIREKIGRRFSIGQCHARSQKWTPQHGHELGPRVRPSLGPHKDPWSSIHW